MVETAIIYTATGTGIPAKIPVLTMAGFKKNPRAFIELLRKELKSDIGSGAHLDDFSTCKFFNSLSQKERDEIAAFLKKNYAISLRAPAKLVLAIAKDAIDYGETTYLARHLIVTIYSIDGPAVKEKKPENKPKDDGKYRNVPIEFGSGSEKVTFLIGYDQLSRTPEARASLKGAYEVIRMLNAFIPSKPLQMMEINTYETEAGEYARRRHRVTISPEMVRRSLMEYIVGHEVGHAIFDVLFAKNDEEYDYSTDQAWNNIYLKILLDRQFEILDDSTLKDLHDAYGHPYDNPNEMFASSIVAFVLLPERFMGFVNDNDTSKSTRKLSRMIYCYMRDKVFKGIFVDGKYYAKGTPEYERNDRCKDASWGELEQEALSITANRGTIVRELFRSGYEEIQLAAIEACGRMGIKDRYIVDELYDFMFSNDDDLANRAIVSLGMLKAKDRRLTDTLERIYHSAKDYKVDTRAAALIAMGYLGKKGYVNLIGSVFFPDDEYWSNQIRKDGKIKMLNAAIIAARVIGVKSNYLADGINKIFGQTGGVHGGYIYDTGMRSEAAITMRYVWDVPSLEYYSNYGVNVYTFNQKHDIVRNFIDGIDDFIYSVDRGDEEVRAEVRESLRIMAKDWRFIWLLWCTTRESSGNILAGNVLYELLGMDKDFKAIIKGMHNGKAVDCYEFDNEIIYLLRDPRYRAGIISSLKGKDPFYKRAAGEALKKIGIEDYMPVFEEILRSSGSASKIDMMGVINEFGIKDARLNEPIIDAASDKNIKLRITAVSAIGNMGIKDEAAVAPLVSALSSDVPELAIASANTIAQLKIKDRRFIRPLFRALASQNSGLRSAAAAALSVIGLDRIKEEDRVAFLADAIKFGDDTLRVMAAEMVGATKEKRILPQLIGLIAGGDPVTRKAAMDAAGLLGIKDESMVSPLLGSLLSSDIVLSSSAAMAIGRIWRGEQRFVDPLVAGLRNREEDKNGCDINGMQRAASAEALGWLGVKSEKAFKSLIWALKDKNVAVRNKAAESIGMLLSGDPKRSLAIVKMLQSNNEEIRDAALLTLRKYLQKNGYGSFTGIVWHLESLVH